MTFVAECPTHGEFGIACSVPPFMISSGSTGRLLLLERTQILGALAATVRAALEHRALVAVAMNEVVGRYSEQSPPEWIARMTAVSREYGLAIEAVDQALQQQDDYLLYGRLPPDLDDRSAC